MSLKPNRYWVDVLDEGVWRTVAATPDEGFAYDEFIVQDVGRMRVTRVRHRSWAALVYGIIFLVCDIAIAVIIADTLMDGVVYGFMAARLSMVGLMLMILLVFIAITVFLFKPDIIDSTEYLGPAITRPRAGGTVDADINDFIDDKEDD